LQLESDHKNWRSTYKWWFNTWEITHDGEARPLFIVKPEESVVRCYTQAAFNALPSAEVLRVFENQSIVVTLPSRTKVPMDGTMLEKLGNPSCITNIQGATLYLATVPLWGLLNLIRSIYHCP